jgi:defect-in-organelle-trafficking protein DotC
MTRLKMTTLAAALALVATQSVPAHAQQAIAGLGWDAPKVVDAGDGAAPPSLDAIRSNKVSASVAAAAETIPTIRAEAIQEAAASYGARAALAHQLTAYKNSIMRDAHKMDRLFAFERQVLSIPIDASKATTAAGKGNGEYAAILPAVILSGKDMDSFPNADEMRIADETFKIYADEKLIPVDKATGRPAAPSWRDYLFFSFQKVEKPHATLMPRTPQENALWDEWVSRGWSEGESQAKQMIEAGWARLDRDYNGMATYHAAVGQGMATRPEVGQTRMGVTGGGKEMRVNDRVLRITDHTTLVPDSKKWSRPAGGK